MSRPFRPLYVTVFALALSTGLAGCASRGAAYDPVAEAARPDAIDLPAFMGTWYVVARIPNLIERGHIGGRMQYVLQAPGEVGITYTYRTGPREPWRSLELTGAVQAGSGGRDWRVRFFRVVPTTQRILEIDPDGQWALLGAPGRELAWIFARSPDMDETTYRALRERLRQHGVDTDKVWRVVHTAEQVGQRGFDQPNRP